MLHAWVRGCVFWCEDWKTLEKMGVDVEDFKMGVRKQMGYIWFSCLRVRTKCWSNFNINIRLIFGIDVFITAEFITKLVSIVG
jgi:hypothetical protein